MSKRVLVVDDEPDIVNFMERFLIRMGIAVMKATDGAVAVDTCRNSMPDCIFLDIQMPGKDGIQVLSEVRCMNADLPVIMITGKDDESSRQQALNAGACDYITKPIDLDELNSKIHKYILNPTP